MTPEEFQKKAMTFAVYEQSIYPFIALAEEAGEVSGKIAKFIRKNNVEFEDAIAMAAKNKTELGKELYSALKDELSDVYWNICACLHELKQNTPETDYKTLPINANIAFASLQKMASYPYAYIINVAFNKGWSVKKLFQLYTEITDIDKKIPNSLASTVVMHKVKEVYGMLLECCAGLNITIEQLGEHNITKLTGRKERNTIKGSGDNR